MKTSIVKPAAPKWLLIDAANQSIGKVAVRVATILRGKNKPTFSPHLLLADHVVVINAAKMALPPKKGIRKTYHRHTGFPGNMKVANLEEMMRRDPAFVVENAVKGMLESNRLREKMLQRMHVYADDKHEYEAQKPKLIPLTHR